MLAISVSVDAPRPAPTFKPEPSGPMCRILRRMLILPLVTAVNGAGRVVAAVGPEHVSPPTLAGLLTRGLVEEVDATDVRSVYALTAAGRYWAGEGQ